MRATLLIALDTFQEARRRRIVVVALVMAGLFLLLYTAGLHFVRRELSAEGSVPPSVSMLIMGEMLILGLWASSFVTSLTAIFLAAGVVRNDVEQGYLHVLLVRPVSRPQLIAGRWLGITIMVTALTSAMSAVVLLDAQLVAGYSPANPIIVIAFLTAQPLVLTSLATLGSVFLPSVGNGIVVFVLFMVAMLAGTVEQIAYLVRQETLATVGRVIGFLVPTDIPWRQAAAFAQPDVLSSIQIASPFSAMAAPTVWMDLYILLYSLLCIALASLSFSFRDL